jgi:PAS domain S-box-containing protein
MNRSQKRRGYIVAVVGSALVLVARLALAEPLAEQARLLPFVLAVMAAAWTGGLGPGVLATALGAILGVLFILPPPLSMQIDTVADALNAAIFVVIGISISLLCEALHAAHRRETEKQFRTLADSIPQLVWMARPDGYRFWFNRRWYDYTGTTFEQVEGTGWQSSHDPAVLPRVLASWHAALASGEPWEDTYPLRRRDGQMRWHLSRAVPVKNERGEIVCWFGTATDIEDRIEAERELKNADARKDQFLAVLAHELRNPLSPVSNALQLMPHVMNDREELEHLRVVMERQVHQMVRLIDDLMDVPRITRGKINLRRERVDLRGVIEGVVESVQPMVESQSHHLTVTLAEEPLDVNGDAARLTQVISNILNNAMKYSVRNGAIAVSACRSGEFVVARIRDDGPGIPPHLLAEIFEPFRQIDRSLDRSQGGLGIGLWLTRQLVEMHRGTVEARSEGTGKGTEFVVTLPAAAPVDDEDAPRTPLPAPTGVIDRHRILVVDDFEESAETLVTVLQTIGQEAVAVYDPMVAIEWTLANHPDVVFLDIAMPGLDGYGVARRLREHPELRDTVLVALTGYGQQGDRKRALEAGFDVHLTKPSDIGAIKDLLRGLRAHHATTETVSP